MSFNEYPGFKIEVLKPDWRLTPSATRNRATGADKIKKCADCGRKRVSFEQQIRYGKNKAYCSDCKRKNRENCA